MPSRGRIRRTVASDAVRAVTVVTVSTADNGSGEAADAFGGDSAARDAYKWKAFAAIGLSLTTMVMAYSMVFVALSPIADEFGVTLGQVSWVVIAQALTVSALMLPMGRLADMVGRRRVHLTGLVLFGGGAACTALAPTFALLIAARVVMAVGSAMGQSVGTAMIISVFPERERGKAIGSQTTAVAIGAASGPVVGGLVLQVLPWQALFLMLVVPISIAFFAGQRILDEKLVSHHTRETAPFDWAGAVLSGLGVIALVLTINDPAGQGWSSPLVLGGAAVALLMFVAFVRWELRTASPMLELRLFQSPVFSMAVVTRLVGFMGTTVVWFLMPVFLISLRGLGGAAAGGVLFVGSVAMGITAQTAGRLSDRFGPKRFSVAGFALLAAAGLSFSTMGQSTSIALVMVALFVNGMAMGMWNVPNTSMIMGAVPPSRFGVVGAFTNLTRNVGNVVGQAIASAVVVGVMAAQDFDVPLSDIADLPGAGSAFVDGWRVMFVLVTIFASIGLVLSALTRTTEPAVAAEPAEAPGQVPLPRRV